MRKLSKALAAAAVLAQAMPLCAHAAPKTISARLIAVAPELEAIKLPALGRLGDLSIGKLGTLPGLSAVKVPLFGSLSGLPEAGTLKVSDALGLVESLAPLQHPLQGFKPGKLSGLLKP